VFDTYTSQGNAATYLRSGTILENPSAFGEVMVNLCCLRFVS